MGNMGKPDVLNPIHLVNTPGAELAFIFENHDINNYEELLGIQHLKEKEHLTKAIIRKSEKLLHLDAILIDFFERFEQSYKEHKTKSRVAFTEAKKQFTKLKPIIPLLRNEFNSSSDILNDILDFFDADSANDVFTQSEMQATLYRKQNNHEPDPINLYGWLRRGELDFAKMELSEYNENALKNWIDTYDWKQHLTDASYFKHLPNVLSAFGVGLSLVPHLQKTVYGAIRWYDGRPLIQISDRNHDLASCWFTLFHEFGHAFLHKNMEILEGNINETKAKQNAIERVANKFANDYLFNGDDLRKAIFDRLRSGVNMKAKELASEFNVAQIFVSYWLRRAQYQPAFQSRVHIEFTDDYQ